MKRINFLGSPMDVASMSETVALIRDCILRQEFTQHVVVNVAKLVNMRKDPELAQSVTECDIINIDGMGVVWGARFLGHQVPERVAGVDLFLELNAMAAQEQMPVFYLGAKQEIVEKTAAVMQAKHPQLVIAGYHHGYFWDDEQAIVEKSVSQVQNFCCGNHIPEKRELYQPLARAVRGVICDGGWRDI